MANIVCIGAGYAGGLLMNLGNVLLKLRNKQRDHKENVGHLSGSGKVSYRRDSREGPSSRRFWVVAFLLVFATAAIPRLLELGRSLWEAETWVANSILANSLSQMFYYDAWLQTTPPLFLLLARAVVEALGTSNLTLRLLPFIFGMASVILTAALAVRLFRLPFAILCTMLIGLAPTAIRYSLELKQYTGDLAVSAAILLALWAYLERNRGAYLWVMLLFSTGVFLSPTSVMFVPLAACVVLFAEPDQPLMARIRRCAGLLLLVGVLAFLDYFCFVKPNLAPNLDKYWSDGFLNSFRPSEVSMFYMKNLAGSAIYFFLPDQAKDVLKTLVTSVPVPIWLIMLLGVLAAVTSFLGVIRHDARRLWILCFSLAPAVTLIALNLLRLYPVDSRRLMLFLLPCVALGITLLLETLWQLTSRLMPYRGQRFPSIFFGVMCVLLALVLGTRPVLWHVWETEDVEGAVRYLKSAVEEGDAIYVHGSAVESVKLYVRMLEWPEAPVVYGLTGWPCCIREQQMQMENDNDASIRSDVARARAAASKGSLWLVYGSEAGGIPEIQLDYLRTTGCSVQQQILFTRFVLYKLSCSGAVPRVPD